MMLDSLFELVDNLVPTVYYIPEPHAPKTDQTGRLIVHGIDVFGERVCVVHPDVLPKLEEAAEREGVRLLDYKHFNLAQSKNLLVGKIG